MQLTFGRRSMTLELADDQRVTHHHGPPPLADVPAAVRVALEAPYQFPALRLALTPDDRITIVIDEALDDPLPLLGPVLDHLHSAGISPDAVTLVSAGPRSLPGHAVRQHDPTDRGQLAYLASTQAGRRLYLDRAVVEAEQVIVLSARRYDSWGAEASLFPALSDEPTRAEVISEEEGREVAWLLGLPFHVQVIDAAHGGVSAVVAGASDAAREGERLRDRHWRVSVPRRPDTVVVTAPPKDLILAAENAARVIQPNGRIVLLLDGSAELPEGMDLIQKASDPEAAVAALRNTPHRQAKAWAAAVAHARISVLSGLESSLVEELFASPLAGPEQVQRLVARSGDCLLLEDGHRSLAVLE